MAATIVLVHGAWHGAWCWTKVIPELRALGISVVAPDLPGHGDDTSPVGDVAVDAARVVEVVRSLDGPVVLVGHSYGGVVISEAANDPVVASKVARLVYLCAIVCPPGKGFFDIEADHTGSKLEALLRFDDAGLSFIDTSDQSAAKAAFYGDCSDDDVAFAAARLTPQPGANATSAFTGNPLATISATYIRCLDDATIPLAVQDAMIAVMTPVSKEIDTIDMAASHSPFFSQPAALAAHLASIVSRHVA